MARVFGFFISACARQFERSKAPNGENLAGMMNWGLARTRLLTAAVEIAASLIDPLTLFGPHSRPGVTLCAAKGTDEASAVRANWARAWLAP